MKKNFKLMISLVVAIFTLSMFGNTAFADGGNSFKDGTYEIGYSITYDGEGESPVDLSDFFIQPATLTVGDEGQFIKIEHTAPDMILSLTVNGEDVEVVSKDDKTRVVQFGVDGNLSDSVSMELNMFYGQSHPTSVDFNVSEVPLEEDGGEKEDPEGDEGNGTTNDEEEDGNGAVEDNGDNDDGAATDEEEDEVVNPQTGDSSNILLYSLMMIGALVPLTIIAKKTFN